MRYWGYSRANVTLDDVKSKFNPYRYGHIWEASANADGTYTAEKLLALGRASFEMGCVGCSYLLVACLFYILYRI